MKSYILVFVAILALIFFAGNVEAEQVTFAWDANPANAELTILGYTVRYWEVSDPATVKTKTVDGLTLTATVTVPVGDWRFVVDCFTNALKSDPSNEVTHAVAGYTPPPDNMPVDDIAPNAPGGLRRL